MHLEKNLNPNKKNPVLVYYLWNHFQSVEKPKEDPSKSKILLLRGVDKRNWRGVNRQEPSKPPRFFITQKLKNENVPTDNRQVPKFLRTPLGPSSKIILYFVVRESN